MEAMAEEMARDERVFLMGGEDIARQGGIFGQFKESAAAIWF